MTFKNFLKACETQFETISFYTSQEMWDDWEPEVVASTMSDLKKQVDEGTFDFLYNGYVHAWVVDANWGLHVWIV